MKLQAPKGTKDICLDEATKWQMVEQTAKTIFETANFKEIRTPIFEYTELFARGVGEHTDIVNKEMYSFIKEERSYTLRPENTAGVVRSYIQEGMFKLPSPQKLWYKGPMFRYERPQSGRQRQFHQIGMEMFGAPGASADAEVILMALKLLKNLNLNNYTLYLNNIGCPKCRHEYKENIKKSLEPFINQLCEDCKKRYHNNPLRLLDCKNESCQAIYSQDPANSVISTEFICHDCSVNYIELKDILQHCSISYKINKKLVRGLDYYNGAVFEITSENLGAQNAVCGGGRYDGLVELIGGPPTPGVGWALGVERLIALLSLDIKNTIDVYIVTDQMKQAMVLADILRDNGFKVDINFSGSNFKKQMDKANKLNAKFAIILGANEANNNCYTIKNLITGDQYTYDISNTIACIRENV